MEKKIEKLLSVDPIGAFDKIKENYLRYFRTMYKFRDFPDQNGVDFKHLNDQLYGTSDNDGNLCDHKGIIEQDGNLFKDPYIELLPEYKAEEKCIKEYILGSRTQYSWPDHFETFIGYGLMPETIKPYCHQVEMLRLAYHEKKNVVITSGTGSGKTESFLLPLFASLLKEAQTWPQQSYDPKWYEKNNNELYDRAYQRLNENTARPAAIRSLILYPMNALVNDQIARLRKALDSEECRKLLDEKFKGNRIFFGRYNGETIGSQNLDTAEDNKLEQCCKELNELVNISKAISNKITSNKLDPEAEFVAPRFSDDPNSNHVGAEMLTRYDMIEFPPDIFITNVSMLSVAMMRSYEDDIFDKTRRYYETHPDATFHLIVDELHLHRGTSGSEVAYLLRTFLERIGMRPMVEEGGRMVPNKNLRILASSASLGEEHETQKFLEEFFGVYNEDGSSVFEVVGQKEKSEFELYDLGLKIDYNDFREFATHTDANNLHYVDNNFSDALTIKQSFCAKYKCKNIEEFIKKYHIQIYYDWRQILEKPKSIYEVAQSLLCDLSAIRGFFIFRGDEEVNNLAATYKLPRIRFHQFFKYIEGLWGELVDPQNNQGKCIGKLMYQPEEIVIDGNGTTHKVLELLRCECCGTLYIGGNRHIANHKTSIHLNTPNLESIPNRQATPMVQNKKYKEYAVFMPTTVNITDEKIPFIDENGERREGRKTDKIAKWKKHWLNPFDGSLSQVPIQGGIEGYLYTFTRISNNIESVLDPEEVREISALPCSCPHCDMDYTYRKYTKSPIRSFRSGIKRNNQILVKELMYQLNDKKQEAKQTNDPNEYYQTHGKLITFSDSRQDAAELSYGIATEHFRDMMRFFMVEAINNSDNSTIPLEELLVTNKVEGAIVKQLLHHGINPAGVDYADQEHGEYYWDHYYNFANNTRKKGKQSDFPEQNICDRLQSFLFNNCFSRYMGLSCEDAGLGYITIDEDNLPNQAFTKFESQLRQYSQVKTSATDFLNGYIRVLGDNYRFDDPESITQDWKYYRNDKLYKEAFSTQCRKPIEKITGKNNDCILGEHLMQALGAIATTPNILLDPSLLLFKFVGEDDPYYRCEKCGRVHLHKGMGFCTNTACMGDLKEKGKARDLRRNNFISYDIITEQRKACRINSQELTGQTDNQTKRLLEFKNVVLDSTLSTGKSYSHTPKTKEIDLLNVTTTMEVGVDIGSLQAIFQGNMPPTRYNYQQRVGRGGRRGQAFSAAITFCRGKSHDNYFYSYALEEITGGTPKSPTLSVNPYYGGTINLSILHRVVLKHILMYAFKEIRQTSGIELNVIGDTHGQFGTIEQWASTKNLLTQWITSNKGVIDDICRYYLRQFERPGDDTLYKELTQWIMGKLIDQIDDLCNNIKDKSKGLAQSLAESGFLPLYGMPTTIRSLYHGQKNDGTTRKIDRSLEQAITEFAPGSIKTKDAGYYRSVGLTVANDKPFVDRTKIGTPQPEMDPLSDHRFITYSPKKDIIDISDNKTNPNEIKLVIPQAFRTGTIIDNNGKLSDNTDARSAFSSSQIFVSEAGKYRDISFHNTYCLNWNCNAINGKSTEIWHINDNSGKGYNLKRVFRIDHNQVIDPGFSGLSVKGNENKLLDNSPVYLDLKYKDDWAGRGKYWYPNDLDNADENIALGAYKVTEVLKLSVKQCSSAINLDITEGYAPAIKSAYFSAATLIQRYFADEMDIEPEEIEISVQSQNGKLVVYLSDKLENGAGFIRTLCSPGKTGKTRIVEIMEDLVNPKSTTKFVRSLYSDEHTTKCKTSCRTCLNTYDNQGLHHILDWRLGVDLIKLMLDSEYDMGLYDFKHTPYNDLSDIFNAVRNRVEKANRNITVQQNGAYTYFSEREAFGRTNISYLIHPLWNEEQLPKIYFSGQYKEHKSHNIFQLLRGVYETTYEFSGKRINVQPDSIITPDGIIADDDDLI